jgi:hypothetical protein
MLSFQIKRSTSKPVLISTCRRRFLCMLTHWLSSVLTKPVKEGSLKSMLDAAQERRLKRLNAALQQPAS